VLEFGRGIGGRVAETRQRIFVADVTQDPRMVAGEWVVQAGLRALLAVPIEAGEHLLGVLSVVGREGTLAAEEDQEVVASLAALAGVALQNARAYAQAIRRAKRLDDLVAVSQSITASLDTKDVMERVARAASAMTPGALASVHVHDAERDTLAFAATTDPALESFARVHPVALGLPGLVVERRVPVLVADPVSDPRTSRPEWWRQRPGATYYGVPIVVGETFMGVLDYILPSGPPEREEQEALQLLAAQAGVAIRNAALYQAERGQTERTRTLAAINRRISGALDLDDLLRMISEAAAQLTGTRFVFFWLADDAMRTLSFRGGSVPEIAGDFPDSTRSYDVGAAGWVARHRTAIDIPDVFADDRMTLRAWWIRWRLRSFSAHPVVSGDELLAVLSLTHSEPIELSRETREVLDLLIAQGSVAIQNARLYRAAQRRRDVAEALARLGRDLTGTLDHARIAQLVAQGLLELLGSRDSAVYSLEPTDGTLHVLAWSGADAELLRGVVLAPGEGAAGRAVAERRLVSSRDVLQDPTVRLSDTLRSRLVAFRQRAIVSAPLIARDQVIGALILADDDRQYTAEELQVFQTFADHAALALDNARLYASARDSLDRLRETQAQLVQAGKLSALGQLISGVAHELNNPLSVIIGYGQLLATRQLPDNVRRPLEMIVQQGDRMAKIVHNLLYFSRQRPPEHSELDLHEIIEQTLALRLNQLTLSGIVVERELAPDLPTITGDTHQLQQVFLNLLLNAEQALTGAAKGGGRIVFRTTVADDGRAVRASVIDDGPGIAPETLPRVFEPFFTTKDVGAGTGLGLSVSYGIAQEHRGRLTVESRPGHTAFTLELPVGSPAMTPGADAVVHAPVSGRGRHALVVEDEPSVRDFIVVLLEESGWRVDTAGGGHAALAMARQTAYELIVCDVRMPDGSGEEFYRRVVDHDAALRERFVFITGDTANPAAWEFLQRTGVPALEKPFSTGALLDAVRRIVSREGH
jgi:GAF domain-containing protein/ActR/RegA family two-component response regulator